MQLPLIQQLHIATCRAPTMKLEASQLYILVTALHYKADQPDNHVHIIMSITLTDQWLCKIACSQLANAQLFKMKLCLYLIITVQFLHTHIGFNFINQLAIMALAFYRPSQTQNCAISGQCNSQLATYCTSYMNNFESVKDFAPRLPKVPSIASQLAKQLEAMKQFYFPSSHSSISNLGVNRNTYITMIYIPINS